MLLRYIVSNFKSIGHPVEFSMFPTEENTDERFLKTIKTKEGDWKVLRRGVFLGPNASGKSSFIESLFFARDYIVNAQKSGKVTGVNQFKGNFKDLKGISSFQFVFYLEGEVYEYGFSLDHFQVCEEWLSQLTEKDMEPLFTRFTDKNGKTEIEIADKFASSGSQDRNLVELLKNSIQRNQKNQLFLYKLNDNGIKKAEELMGWFRSLQVVFPQSKIRALPIRMQNGKLREYIGEMLAKLDTGVYKISVARTDIDFHKYAEQNDLPKEIIDDIEEIRNGIVNLNGKSFIFLGNQKRTILIQIKFEHCLNDEMVQFNLDEESDGTQRLVDLLPMLFSIGNSPVIYFVDELDRSLHTKLSQFLLDEFVRRSENGNSQLIFTAHDVNLINLHNFRQDEIWFIEKNQMGESTLKPLSDFKIEEGQDALKSYLSGRFGAVPMIRGKA